MTAQSPILILGAGINGAAIARELVLNGMPVVLVDTADLAFGATAYASRLIHGGLRYLEYGEFDLVRESLAERTRLLRLAPQFVRPLRLFIPIENRFGGLWCSAERFLFKGGRATRPGAATKAVTPRGLWLVQMGLRMYDAYARDPDLPHHATHRRTQEDAIEVSPQYRWLCSYYDVQIRFPERYVVAMLDDALQVAVKAGIRFDILNYHRAVLDGRTATIYPLDNDRAVASFEPAAVINATGAWIDLTLQRLGLPSGRLMGGTKGSHIVTWNPALHAALTHNGRSYAGLYAEAADGRPVFVLPFGDASLIGTTDEEYVGDPAAATATQEEIEYLIETTNSLLPEVKLTTADVDLHYSGVRPLPYVGEATPATVTRRHSLTENLASPVPFYSVIGGKLTTSRSLAEETTSLLFERLGRKVTATSEQRPLPGAAGYPSDPGKQMVVRGQIAARTSYSEQQIAKAWELYGTRCEEILSASADDRSSLIGTDLPVAVARFAIRSEWVRSLSDLVERRLMLLYHHRLYERTLEQLARLMAEERLISPESMADEVSRCSQRLRTRFGKQIIAGVP